MNINPVVSSPPEDFNTFESNNLPGEILPRYPVEAEQETFVIPQAMNPDIIEGPPHTFNGDVGAINEGLLDKYNNNEVRVLTLKHSLSFSINFNAQIVTH